MKKISDYVIFLLIIIYAIYDVLGSASAGNSNTQRNQVYILLLIIIFLMFIVMLYRRFIRLDIVTKALAAYIIYFGIDVFIIKNDVSWGTLSYFALIIWWILTVNYFREGQSRDKTSYVACKKFTRIMFLFYFVTVFYSSRNITMNFGTVQYARVGYIYHVLGLLPFVLLEQEKKIKIFFIVLTVLVTIFSFKRGAIIILPLTLMAYFFIENKTKHANNNILRVILAMLAFVIVWLLIDNYSNGYLSSRFALTDLADGSGRADLFRAYLHNISQRGLLQIAVGIISNNEIPIGLGAHNEWINQLYSYGVIGVLFYAMIIVSMIVLSVRLVKKKSVLAASFCAMTAYSIGIGMVSGWLFMHSTLYIMMYIGLILSLNNNNEETIVKILNYKKGKLL